MSAGIAKARVLPDPVGAIPTKSWPSSKIFMDLDCI